jgi:hypothetical protein
MLDERLIIVSTIIYFIGGLSYLIDTLKGKVKPNRITWFLWAVAPLIAFSAELQKGVGLVSLMTFSMGFLPLLVFIATFINKKSYWKVKNRDYICGGLSFLGLGLWYITKEGNIAILFSILADGFAAVPTIIKSYYHPETETSKVYLLAAFNAAVTLLTIKVWSFAHYSFPLYILILCVLLFILIKFKIGKKLNL